MAYVICFPCIGVKDTACVDACPVDCIHPKKNEAAGYRPDVQVDYEHVDQLYIHPEECIDCGACQPVCPVSAIYPQDEVPREWEGYIQKNRDFYAMTWEEFKKKYGIEPTEPAA